MVIVRAAWCRRFGLCLWAEHDRARRRTGTDGHPFACGPARLLLARRAGAGPPPGPASGADGAQALLRRLGRSEITVGGEDLAETLARA